jgi:vacuolar-type H+-ATPase subunit H
MAKKAAEGSRLTETLDMVLGIEAQARAIVSEAQEMATMIRQQAKAEQERALAEARENAESEAKELIERAAQEAEEERQRILSQSGRERQELEEKGNFDKAVVYVVNVLSGKGDA